MIAYRYLPSSREELNETAAFYEARVTGLGAAFLDDVDHAVETVRDNPLIGGAVGRGFRKMVLRRFPYSVIYVHRDDEIVVVAIAHQRKRPGFWRGRQ